MKKKKKRKKKWRESGNLSGYINLMEVGKLPLCGGVLSAFVGYDLQPTFWHLSAY